MIPFRADLHLHTVLSPCGDLEMSPSALVKQAHLMGLKIIGITDHNSTRHARLVQELAARKDIFVLCGAEVTSKEETHLLCFMPNGKKLDLLQNYIDTYLQKVTNNVKFFGEQLLVNEHEEILEEEDYLLINAIDQDVNQISEFVLSNGGIFIPAHVDRQAFSLRSQLGFIPPDLKCDALEISKHSNVEQIVEQFGYVKDYNFIRSSDAHYINDIGSGYTNFYLQERSFEEIRMALHQEEGRYCEIPG
jgi:PHP family Zn ribbon phosphoesterase